VYAQSLIKAGFVIRRCDFFNSLNHFFMAIIKNGAMSGPIHKTTYYSFENQTIARSKPGPGGVKQTEGMRKSALYFGRASAMVHPLLNGLTTELNFKISRSNKGKLVSRAKAWLTEVGDQAGSSLHLLQPAGELNNLAALEKIVKVPVNTVLAEDNTVTVAVGAFNPFNAVKAPAKTDAIELKAVLVTLKADKDWNDVRQYPVSLSIPYADAEVGEQTLSFPVPPAPGMAILIGWTVCFKGYRIPGTDKDPKWLPAGVLGIGKIG
jgi:hypothetical protein